MGVRRDAACMKNSPSKRCPQCKVTYADKHLGFSIDSSRSDGISWRCRKCAVLYVNKAAQRRRDARRYELQKSRCLARDKARKEYKGKAFKCAVVTCSHLAEELHHVDYNEALAVVPLCRVHHKGMHF